MPLINMTAYNEKTIKGMYIYLTKKIGIPTATELSCISWNQNTNFIAAGGTNGVLKVVKLAPIDGGGGKDFKGIGAPNNLSVNQNLEGHSGSVICVSWNETYQKLTSSDSNGLIIVWSLHNEHWYEEMINNRNKSMVVGMAWNNEGTRIAIAYQDGQVIVGTMDGNRIWNKDLPGQLAACTWAPDGSMLLFGMVDGEVHAYDLQGNFVQKLHMVVIENVEMTIALEKDLRKYNIIALRWFAAAPRTKYVDQGVKQTVMMNRDSGPPKLSRLPSTEALFPPEPKIDSRPKLLIAYEHGVIQLMRNESDTGPIVVRLPNMTVTCACWSPNGAFFAVTGQQADLPKEEKNVVIFLTAFGVQLRTLKVSGTRLTGCSWDPSGLRVVLSIDSHIYFAHIRPEYKWAYCGQTIVYAFEKEDRNEFRVIFYETKLEEFYSKPVKYLEAVTSFEDYCILASRSEESQGNYLLQLCNGIGTPVDFKITTVEPKVLAMNGSSCVVASTDSFFIWHFTVPKRTTLSIGLHAQAASKKNDNVYFLDAQSTELLGGKKRRSGDVICALALGDVFFLAATEHGSLYMFSLADGRQINKYTIERNVEKMSLNCTHKRLAAVNHHAVMKFYDISETECKHVSSKDRQDVWSFQWDAEKDDAMAIMEKTKMYVIRGNETEEPVTSSGYICSFKSLTVRTVIIDYFLRHPTNPDKKYVIDMEIKSLRDAKYLLEKMKIREATAFIEKNSHPKLWSLLAEVALNRMDLVTAEHAYVMLGDYNGLQFCKRLSSVQVDEIKKAEIAAHLGKLDEAERLFIDNDRRDLAIDMRKRMNDWFRILQIIQSSSGPGDDILLTQAWNKVGDYFAERGKWATAGRHYEQGKNLQQLVKCYMRMDDFGGLEQLLRHLPDGHPLLCEIAELLGNCGLWQPSVDAYLRCEKVNDALDVCIKLNQWEKAVNLSRTHNLRDVDALLGKYAAELTGSNARTHAAVQLYKRAGKFIEAAKIVFEIAEDERRKAASLLRLKKLYVLGALLIEEYHEQCRNKVNEGDKNGANVSENEARAALSGLLASDTSVSLEDSRLIDKAWRGAEAYHFFMLAQEHLYQGNTDGAMKTALYLTEFDDILDPVEVYALLALSSCATRQFSVCSQAFMKLDSLQDLNSEEKEAYKKLAMKIFSKFPPTDTRPNKVECSNCDALIPDYSTVCPECDVRLPVCVVTGRPLMDYQFWLCPVCKHRAYEQHINNHRFCPLCHAEMF